ncbi:MAG: molybdopterin synthase catalytic subunit MoaE, partial [Reinekea sp.]
FFVGRVRDLNDNDNVYAMTLEHYPGMTEKSLHAIAEQARQRWPLNRIRIIHRVGRMLPADQIVFVAASSPHRQAAFAGVQFIMDYLKTQAPFWKKEETPGGSRWVEAKESDEEKAKQW